MEQANTITEYLKIIERYKVYPMRYYREQLEKYKNIPPSIDRNQGYSSNESKIYHETLNMCSNDFKDLITPLEKLSKLQHYGIPTRLVDLTIDPLIALYFAVENTNDKSHGNVYIYCVNDFSFDSKEAKLLSILPTISKVNTYIIKSEYEKIFGESINDNEILEIVNSPIIIKYSDELIKTNPRLYSQKGTFLICGNKVVDNVITNSLKSLDTINPNVIIRIPYEYKKEIKDHLDLSYGINQHKIYPELSSAADYIKEKYKKENFSLDGKYSIINIDDSLYFNIKRTSVTLILNEPFQINQVKTIVCNVVEQYKKQKNIIWVLVACNGDDYILKNWFLRCQWIDPNLNEDYRPITFKHYENGCYWDYNQTFSTLNDFNNKYIFEDDKKLFISNQKVWEQFLSIYEEIYKSFQKNTWEKFLVEFYKNQSQITSLFMQLQNFGHSHNKEFDDFLKEFSYCIVSIDNLHYELENEKISEKNQTNCFL